ncbi:MAG: hypothetical protein K2X27_15080 [Candidatus Obscuribacterales bacterium]|nr:hypothetical protein [Candidatus Obscuribacterales bacterium]
MFLKPCLSHPLLILLISFFGLFKPPASQAADAPSTDAFLDELEKAHFQYFLKHSDQKSGLTMDSSRPDSACSIAAVGFSLSAHIVAAQRSYISRADARDYVLKTLRTLWSLPQSDATGGVSGYRGFFYHFLDGNKGWTRAWNCELSSIDTALLMAGVLSCKTYFDALDSGEHEIRDLAQKLFDRVEWDFMYRPSGFISMGWNPEKNKGFLKAEWNMYCEGPILLIEAIGSATHPVPAKAWLNYTGKFKLVDYDGQRFLNFTPTYGYQYPQCWIDFRELKDSYTAKKSGFDYFENAKRTLLAQHKYAVTNPMGWRDYGADCWGLTACDGPGFEKHIFKAKKVEFRGYSSRGPHDFDDGTIAPTAIAASLPYAPDLVLPTLRKWRESRPEIWGDCGFRDAFNPSFDERKASGWVDSSFLGIDQGPIVLMIENHRSAYMWNLMKKNDVILRGLSRAEFKGAWLPD